MRVLLSCLASVAEMHLQAVQAIMAGLAHAPLPSLPHPGGCMESPRPTRLLPSPAGTERHKKTAILTKMLGEPGNSLVALSAPVPSQIPKPALNVVAHANVMTVGAGSQIRDGSGALDGYLCNV